MKIWLIIIIWDWNEKAFVIYIGIFMKKNWNMYLFSKIYITLMKKNKIFDYYFNKIYIIWKYFFLRSSNQAFNRDENQLLFYSLNKFIAVTI